MQHRHSKFVSIRGKERSGLSNNNRKGKFNSCCHLYERYWNIPSTSNRVPEKKYVRGAPAGSISACHPSGWVQKVMFTKWFAHSVHFVKPSADAPVLLIADGQSHTKNLDVVDKSGNTVLPLSVSHHILRTKCSHFMLVS